MVGKSGVGKFVERIKSGHAVPSKPSAQAGVPAVAVGFLQQRQSLRDKIAAVCTDSHRVHETPGPGNERMLVGRVGRTGKSNT